MERENTKSLAIANLSTSVKIIRFMGQTLIRQTPLSQWAPLTSSNFAGAVYSLFGPSLSRSRVTDLEHYFRSDAVPDMSHMSRYVSLDNRQVWDMLTLQHASNIAPSDCIFQTSVYPAPEYEPAAEKFLLEIANGDTKVANDILQSIAPLFMSRRPTGVVWWQGGGANGKTSAMNALYRLLPSQLASITLKQLEDERDTPQLNGKLGNIVRESSESIIEDSRVYKAVGTHEPFSVHKFNSQDQIIVNGDMHHIFSTNNMPIFSDKSSGARRRTLLVKFANKFADDPSFEDRTFTPEFLSGLLSLILKATKQIADQGYKYKFSASTELVKESYDAITNTAETFAKYLKDEINAQYFLNFTKIRFAYEWWCDSNGYSALGRTHLRNAILDAGFSKTMLSINGKMTSVFALDNCKKIELTEVFSGVFASRPVDKEYGQQLVMEMGL